MMMMMVLEVGFVVVVVVVGGGACGCGCRRDDFLLLCGFVIIIIRCMNERMNECSLASVIQWRLPSALDCPRHSLAAIKELRQSNQANTNRNCIFVCSLVSLQVDPRTRESTTSRPPTSCCCRQFGLRMFGGITTKPTSTRTLSICGRRRLRCPLSIICNDGQRRPPANFGGSFTSLNIVRIPTAGDDNNKLN